MATVSLRLYKTHLAEFTWAGDSYWLIRASVPRCVGLQEVLWTSAFPVKLLAARSKKTAGNSICVEDSASLPTASSGEQWESAPQVWVYAGIWSLKTRGAGGGDGKKKAKRKPPNKNKTLQVGSKENALVAKRTPLWWLHFNYFKITWKQSSLCTEIILEQSKENKSQHN